MMTAYPNLKAEMQLSLKITHWNALIQTSIYFTKTMICIVVYNNFIFIFPIV